MRTAPVWKFIKLNVYNSNDDYVGDNYNDTDKNYDNDNDNDDNDNDDAI